MGTYAPYNTGSGNLVVTNGSPAISCSTAVWSDLNASAGSIITINGVDYIISVRNSATSITLTANYAGTSSITATYVVGTLVNPTPLTSSDLIAVTNGVTLKITNSAFTTNPVYSSSSLAGTLYLENFAPGYKVGTASVVNGSASVSGIGTSWTTVNAPSGASIVLNTLTYTIASVNVGTQVITLTTTFAGNTNTSPGVPYFIGGLVFSYNTTTVVTSANTPLALFKTRGGWVNIGIGTGAAGQTVSHWDIGESKAKSTTGTITISTAGLCTGSSTNWSNSSGNCCIGDYVKITSNNSYWRIASITNTSSMQLETSNYTGPSGSQAYTIVRISNPLACVWVETVSGSGVYEKYLNMSSFWGYTKTTNPLTTLAGAGKYGRFFTQKDNILTFGDGTYGKCPPSGANIKVPNIVVTCLTAKITPGSGNLIDGTYGAKIDCDKLINCSLYFNTKYSSFSMSSVASANNIALTYTNPTFSDCGFVLPQFESSYAFGFSYCDITMNDCAAYSSGGVGTIQASPNAYSLVVSGGWFSSLPINGTTAPATVIGVPAQVGASLILDSCTLVGGVGAGGDYLSLTNAYMTDDAQLRNTISTASMVTGSITTTIKIANVTVDSGFAQGVCTVGATNMSIINVTSNSTNMQSAFNNNINASAMIGNCYIKTITSSYFTSAYGFGGRITTQNMRSDSYTGAFTPLGSNSIAKGVACNGTLTYGSTTDSNLFEIYTSSTQGAIGILGGLWTTLSNGIITSVGNTYSVGGNIYMNNIFGTASLTIIWPHTIMGITGFQNVAPTIVGTTTTSFTYQYAIDTGSGFGVLKTLSASSLSSETVSASVGFRFKLYITSNDNDTSKNITSIKIPTFIDQTVVYPTSLVSVILNNVVAGSTYAIINSNTSAIISEGTASSSIVTVPNIPYYGSDIPITIRVRQSINSPKYIPYESYGIISVNGSTTWVSQVIDLIA